MRKNPAPESGAFNPRVFLAFIFCSIGSLLALVSFAASPSSGTLSVGDPEITYEGSGPYVIPSVGGNTCAAPDECDEFALTVDLPADYATTNPNDKVRIEISWEDPSGGGADFDMYVLDSGGNSISGSQAAGSSNPELYEFAAGSGTQTYTLRVKPYIPAGLNYSGKITLITPPATPPPPPPFTGIAPRYYTYSPGPGVGETAAEPTVGFNLQTKKAMFISGLQTLRVTFPETGACEALWEDVSYPLTSVKSLDPILFTDQGSNRTFVSQLNSVVPPASPVLIGLNSLMAYTDDDGATWTPAQVNPPDGSYDHQNVGGGAYPATVPLGNAVNKGRAVYYCSQAGVTAFCSRSDDGGLNFGPGRAVYTILDGCGGIHGHVKVAPDGTVYLPVRGCNNVQSVVVSEDAGLTWEVRQVQGTDFQGQPFTATPPPGILDPHIGIASNGTLYFTYIANVGGNGRAMVAVSHDKGLSWVNNYDLGASHGLNNMVFANAEAGDPNRAAVGFLGTTEPGDHQGAGFQGTWYLFMAHTYDGGQSWVTVNVNPNDPVQRNACIWNGGGSNPCRNLLDFNGIAKDDKGRPLYSYSDGCVDDCVNGGPNSYSQKAVIARQSGGRTLLSAFDSVEPALPQAACLSGHRDDMASYLRWKAPDNGGLPLTSYKILRGTTPGSLVQIGTAEGTKTSYNDRSANPAVSPYYYQVIASNDDGNTTPPEGDGDGAPSNVVALSVGPRVENNGACLLPGVQVLVDPTGDPSIDNPAFDITSVSMAEPQEFDGKIVFTIKVANLATVPPGWRWAIRFGAPQAPAPHPIIGPMEDWFVSMVTSDGAAPEFTYGNTGVFQGASRVFVTLGDLDPASNFNADGTITMILPKSAIGNPTSGQAISSIFGSVRATAPSPVPGTGGTNETIPDSTGTGSYALRTATFCLPNTAPLAALEADIESGSAPLTVTLDGSASDDPDAIDNVASYTFNVGDGSDDITQASPILEHTFTQDGLYPVKLVVTDSRGKVSANTALQLISVGSSALDVQSVVSRKNHAGIDRDIELLTGTQAVECRAGGPNNDHMVIFTFANNLTSVGGATVPSGGATVLPSSGIDPANPNKYIVNLTGVTNAQNLTIRLNAVQDAANNVGTVNHSIGFLIGDTSGNGFVNASDVAETKARSGRALTDLNFRSDVNVNGFINASDVAAIKSKSGTALPNNVPRQPLDKGNRF